MNYAPTFPLKLDASSGYEMMTNLEDVVKFHLKNLILTSPGEKISDPKYGVGIKRYLFEPLTPGTSGVIRGRIRTQLSTYFSYLQISDIIVIEGSRENTMEISISYIISRLNVEDVVKITIQNSSEDYITTTF